MIMALHPGLVSRPRKVFFNELLVLFGYLSGSAAAFLGGELPLRYCSGKFACRGPHLGSSCSWSCSGRKFLRGVHAVRAQLPGLVGGAWVLGGGRTRGSRRQEEAAARLMFV